jgi:hypothetical protein
MKISQLLLFGIFFGGISIASAGTKEFNSRRSHQYG